MAILKQEILKCWIFFPKTRNLWYTLQFFVNFTKWFAVFCINPSLHIILPSKANVSRGLIQKSEISSIIDATSSPSSESSCTTSMVHVYILKCNHFWILLSNPLEPIAGSAVDVLASNSMYSSAVRLLSIWLDSSLTLWANSSSSSTLLSSATW